METTLVATTAPGRKPLPPYTIITIFALIGMSLLMLSIMVFQLGAFRALLASIAAISLLIAALLAPGWRWAPLLGAVWLLVLTLSSINRFGYELTHPFLTRNFAIRLFALDMALIGIPAGIVATLQNYGRIGLSTPRWVPAALALLAGITVGAVLVSATPQQSIYATIDPQSLAALPPFRAQYSKFNQTELSAKVGQTVALRFENADKIEHSFDIDELGLHVPMIQGQSSLGLFKPVKPGTYTFYCAVPGHRENGMVGTLTVVP